jgi:hypothetical protein
VLRLHQSNGTLTVADSFTPYNQQFFQDNDLDVSSGLVMLLPQQPDGSNFVLAVDKDGSTYLMNQNNLGGYNPAGNFQIPQELDLPVSGEVHAGLTYWNNTIYAAAEQTPIMAYSFTNDRLSTTPTSQTPKATANPVGGIVSSNGTQNGIFWHVTFPTNKLFAYDATNLANELYDNGMAGKRDVMSPTVHFGMPIVANGKVYVSGQSQLSVFGLLPFFATVGGNNQSGVVETTLPIALEAGLQDPYSGKGIGTSGITVTFTANPKAGSFSNPTTTTNTSGIASTSYTLPSKPGIYTITAASPGYGSAVFTVTATAGSPASMTVASGNNQSAAVATKLGAPLQVRIEDASGNLVSGVSVAFTDGGAGGSFSPATAVTDATGIATTSYTTGTKSGAVTITASGAGLSATFKATVKAGAPTSLKIYAGNNQTVKAGATAAKQLQVLVGDKYGNPVSGISVSFGDGGAGGSFSVDPVATTTQGIAATKYTAPTHTGTVTVTASASGLTSASFTITVD